MRKARITAPAHHEKAYYHCVSRVVNREFVLHEAEKEQFVKYMRMYEKLYGLRVLSFCIMSNHFHILVEVPQAPEEGVSDSKLISLVTESLGEVEGRRLEWRMNHYLKQNNMRALEELRKNWQKRMWDISQYMKSVLGNFTQWFNKKHNRTGTLWEGRFKSTLVQGEGRALKAMAAYIDLNPVRAKICDDPKDYRWCGYAEAVAGNKHARECLRFLTTVSSHGGLKPEEYCPQTMKDSMEMWRRVLFGLPENEKMLKKWRELQGKAEKRYEGTKHACLVDITGASRKRLPREKVLEVMANGGKLTTYETLSCRARHFCEGAALGTKSFVEEVFQENREKFGKRRVGGACEVKGVSKTEESFHTLRAIPEGVFT